jgi:hypothetical protein
MAQRLDAVAFVLIYRHDPIAKLFWTGCELQIGRLAG